MDGFGKRMIDWCYNYNGFIILCYFFDKSVYCYQ